MIISSHCIHKVFSQYHKYILFLFAIFAIPSYLGAESNDKTLVILLAETRSYELTYSNIKENLLDNLNADLAVCIGVKEDYNYDNPFYQNAKYRFLYPEPEDYGVAFDEAYEEIIEENPSLTHPFYWRQFLKIKNQFMGGIRDPQEEHRGSAGILLFYRWFLLKNILEQGLLDQYDYFVITRSDFIYVLPHPSMEVFTSECIYIPDGEYYGGVTDRHVVLPKKFVVPYLNMINNMVVRGQEYYNKMSAYHTWNLEKFIKFHLMENDVWQHVRFFPYIMYSVRPIGGSTRWAGGIFSKKHNYFIKYPSEYKRAHMYKKSFEHEHSLLNKFYKRRISSIYHGPSN